jgi:hypothetical protein
MADEEFVESVDDLIARHLSIGATMEVARWGPKLGHRSFTRRAGCSGVRPSSRPTRAFIHCRPEAVTSFVRSGRDLIIYHRQREQGRLARLVKAESATDGGPWTAVFPDDGLLDSLREPITLSLPDLKPGVHLLMVKATDAAGNVGTGDALLEVPNRAGK